MKPAQPRELDWSWERSPGWRGQMDRVQRWRQRLSEAAGSSNTEATFDIALTFFINCYHLRDWLERSGEVPDAALVELFRNSTSLRICADLANIAKHYDLTREPRMTRQLSLAREYADPGTGWFGSDAHLRVLSDGNVRDVLELSLSCETAWLSFLRERSLI